MRSVLAGLIFPCSILLSGVPGARAALVINEFLADPAGADAGAEFVEFYNSGPGPVDLLGVRFEFGNGSVGPEWVVRWEAETSVVLEPGGFFLLVDRNWSTPEAYQAQAALGLQNGPDAIRLCRQGQVLDLVGYGPLTDPAMLETEAVPLPTGQGLSRRPDGQDSDHNAADFHPANPTPGQRNFAPFALQIEDLVWDPPCLATPGSALEARFLVRNHGLLDYPPSALVVRLMGEEGTEAGRLNTHFAGCPEGATTALGLAVTPTRPGSLRALATFAEGQPHHLERDLGRVMVGRGDLRLAEVMSLPASGEGEWVELISPPGCHTGGYRLKDEEGGWKDLPATDLSPGQHLVVAQDSLALQTWSWQNESQGRPGACGSAELLRALRSLGGAWPTLNNSPPQGRAHADRLYLADPTGLIIDQVTLPAEDEGGFSRGTSWEWQTPGRWQPSLALAGGNPGCPSHPGVVPEPLAVLTLNPAVVDRRQDPALLHIGIRAEDVAGSWHLEIYDLFGVQVRDLGGGDLGGGLAQVLWDLRDESGEELPGGAYVVVALMAPEQGALVPVARSLVVLR